MGWDHVARFGRVSAVLWLLGILATLFLSIVNVRALYAGAALLLCLMADAAWSEWVRYQYERVPDRLRHLRLHWRDLRYARTLADEDPALVESIALLHVPRGVFPDLRYVHQIMKAAHPVPVRTLAEAENVATMLRFGLVPGTGLALMFDHDLNTSAIVDLLDDVPDLTPEDLHRFSLARPLPVLDGQTLRDRGARYAAHFTTAYRDHGERASYYAALRMNPAEQTRMTAEQVPLDTLKALVGLTAEPAPSHP